MIIKTKCPKNIENTNKIYFRKNAGNTSYATPMVIVIGDYEISIAADDSAGAFEQFERTSLCIFKEDEMLLNKRFVTIETILEAIDTINKLQYEDSTKIAVDERENAIKSLCEAVIYIEPIGWDNPNGAYVSTCPFCLSEVYSNDLLSINDIQHKSGCAYLIAKNLNDNVYPTIFKK